MPAHIRMQPHTQAVPATFKSFSLFFIPLSLPGSHSGTQVGPITKNQIQKKREQETRILAGINFFSINKILL